MLQRRHSILVVVSMCAVTKSLLHEKVALGSKLVSSPRALASGADFDTTDICLHLRSTTQWNKHLQRNWFSAAKGQCLAESEETRQMCTLEGQDGKGGASSMH